MAIRSKQTVLKLGSDLSVERLELPSPSASVLGDVRWGRFDDLFTPAFWVSRMWVDGNSAHEKTPNYRLGNCLEEEVVACMLGGFGMRAEVGLAAFDRLRRRRLIRHRTTEVELRRALSEPLLCEGRLVRYRYPRQKARFVAQALRRLARETPPADDLEFRDWLLTFTGIGPKTASWITRNWKQSDRVAILDVHLHRAGVVIGLFDPSESLSKDYQKMEEKLVRFATALGVRLSDLDDLVWRYMKQLNHIALSLLENRARVPFAV